MTRVSLAERVAQRKEARLEADPVHRREQDEERAAKLQAQLDELRPEYTAAFKDACRLDARTWNEKAAKAWDHVAALRGRTIGVVITLRRIRGRR